MIRYTWVDIRLTASMLDSGLAIPYRDISLGSPLLPVDG
jgi:hypothetical protein